MYQNGTNHTICSRISGAVTIVMYSSAMFFSLVGNSLLIVVFYRDKRLRMPVHYFIMNMAISDLLIPAFLVPTAISMTHHNGQWFIGGVLGNILCKFVRITGYVSFAVSMFSMVAIAVDRCYAIVFAMKPALFSQKTCRRLIIVIWIVSVAIQGYYMDAIRLKLKGTEKKCERVLEKVSFLCLFAFTAFVLTVLYSIIIFFLYRQKTDLHLASETVQLRAKENRKITSMLVIVVVGFYFVWIPFYVYKFQEQNIIDYCSWTWITEALPLLYTVINFVVFVVFNKTFREGCRELLYGPWFCTKCNVCSRPSVAPQEHDNDAPNMSQQNFAVENFELQQQ